jgi:type II secretory ATPase GspE/PulE/Tfp pilus assembly ATPase PilB-like protein
MDISGNFGDIMFQYNKNIRDYNDNMKLYLDIIANRERVQAQNNYRNNNRNNNRNNYTYYYTPPLRPLNNIFSNLFPTVRRENTLQDVVVRPTQEQILNATEIIDFDENMSNNNTNCPITLEPFIVGEQLCRIKHCSHLFKQEALNDWFRRNVRCPICRYDIRDYINEASEREEENNDDDYENQNENENNDYSEMVEELLNETIQNQNQQNPSTRNTFTTNLASAIRGFINNELTSLPPSLNNVASELLYTFDIPLSFDVSGNLRI